MEKMPSRKEQLINAVDGIIILVVIVVLKFLRRDNTGGRGGDNQKKKEEQGRAEREKKGERKGGWRRYLPFTKGVKVKPILYNLLALRFEWQNTQHRRIAIRTAVS